MNEAGNLFFTSGYSKVLMADLARNLGMSKKTLYQYFTSKQELLDQVILKYQAEIQQGVENILRDEEVDFLSKTRNIFSYIGTKIHAISPFFVEDIKHNSPQSWKLLQDYAASAYLRFSTLLDEGVRKGYIRKDANRSLAVLLYASSLETILNPDFTKQVPRELIKELPYTPAAVFEGLVKIIFNGILDGDGKEEISAAGKR